MSTLIKLRRDTAANWAATDPVLALGEPGYDTTNNELRIGNGTGAWSTLTPIAGGGGGGNTFSAITMTATPGGASNQIKYGLGNVIAYNDGGWVLGEYDASTDTYGNTGMRINPGIEGPIDIQLPDNTNANVNPLSLNNYVGNVRISATGNDWYFDDQGRLVPPVLSTQRGDNPSGTISGYTVNIGNGTSEAIITTPDGSANTNPNSQRLVINPGAGQDGTSGEGGDIYLWAGRGGTGDGTTGGGSGGDIKIRGGQGMAQNAGGYIRIEAGDSNSDTGQAGYVQMYAGQTTGGSPGYIDIRGGRNNSGDAGSANITGGYSNDGFGGNVNIIGGESNLGLANYGNVRLTAGASVWSFNNDGNVSIPNSIVGSDNNTLTLKGGAGSPIGQFATSNGPTYGYGGALAIFAASDFTSGSVTSVQVGNVVVDNNGNYANVANVNPGIAGPGTYGITLDVNWTGATPYTYCDGVSSGQNIEIQSGSSTWTFDGAGNVTVPAGGFIQTPVGSDGNIGLHPDGDGVVTIQGATPTLLFLSGDMPDTQNKLEIDTYGANLGALGGGVFVGVYRRTGSATLADDKLAQFGGKGTTDGVTATSAAAGRVTVDAAFNWAPGDTPTHISFWTTAVGNTSPIEVARIGAGQNFSLFAGNLTVGNGRVTTNLVNTVSRVVAGLPTPGAATAGSRSFVTDADSRTWGNLVVGGGSNAVPVWTDGSAWYIG